MSMIKISDSDSWNFNEPCTASIPLLRDGTLGTDDRKRFLKRASHKFADVLDNIELHPGETPCHLIIVGATEHYGCNRNGDGFKEAACKKYHDTFVKHAFNYKNHKNRDPKKSYGRVKASFYNDDMHRIELLTTFNTTKEAADHNNGLVAEDWVLKKLATGEPIPHSMACNVAYDTCSSCGNRAKTRKDYCDEESCVGPNGEKRGGCKHNLTKIAYDGHQNHVDNPHPRFFDSSHLSTRPADRIAYGAVADYLTKAASGRVEGGAALAEAWGLGFDLLPTGSGTAGRQIHLANRLAHLESKIANDARTRAKAAAFYPSCDSVGRAKTEDLMRAVSDYRQTLPLHAFLEAEFGSEKAAELKQSGEIEDRLPGVFGRITSTPGFEALLADNAYQPSRELPLRSVRDWASKYANSQTTDICSVQNRASQYIILSNGQLPVVKRASALLIGDEIERICWQYALCKLATFANIEEVTDLELETNLISQHAKFGIDSC